MPRVTLIAAGAAALDIRIDMTPDDCFIAACAAADRPSGGSGGNHCTVRELEHVGVRCDSLGVSALTEPLKLVSSSDGVSACVAPERVAVRVPIVAEAPGDLLAVKVAFVSAGERDFDRVVLLCSSEALLEAVAAERVVERVNVDAFPVAVADAVRVASERETVVLLRCFVVDALAVAVDELRSRLRVADASGVDESDTELRVT